MEIGGFTLEGGTWFENLGLQHKLTFEPIYHGSNCGGENTKVVSRFCASRIQYSDTESQIDIGRVSLCSLLARGNGICGQIIRRANRLAHR
jgi:hypothetical protein